MAISFFYDMFYILTCVMYLRFTGSESALFSLGRRIGMIFGIQGYGEVNSAMGWKDSCGTYDRQMISKFSQITFLSCFNDLDHYCPERLLRK
jgi:hypothetical protein